MEINNNIYQLIISSCSSKAIETGGIIGGKNNIITEFIFDEKNESGSKQHYHPDIETFNLCIENWQNENIQFYGIVHSHFREEKELSFGDTQYIRIIMQAMPSNIKFLYFPIVLPQKELIFFKAVMTKTEINIVKDDVKIIAERRIET